MDLPKLNDPKWYFIDIMAFLVGVVWTVLAILTLQAYLGFIGLAILYRRFRRKKEAA